jgi:hypothetical protein
VLRGWRRSSASTVRPNHSPSFALLAKQFPNPLSRLGGRRLPERETPLHLRLYRPPRAARGFVLLPLKVWRVGGFIPAACPFDSSRLARHDRRAADGRTNRDR